MLNYESNTNQQIITGYDSQANLQWTRLEKRNNLEVPIKERYFNFKEGIKMPKGVYERNEQFRKRVGKKISKTKKKQFKEGKLKVWNKGIHQWKGKEHPRGMFGKKHSKESKKKISFANKGRKVFFTKEWRKNISLALKGKHTNPKYEFKKGRIPYNKNKSMEETFGIEKSKELKKNQSLKMKGRIGWSRGLTKETDKRIAYQSKRMKEKFKKGEMKSWLKNKSYKELGIKEKTKMGFRKGHVAWSNGKTKFDDKRLMKKSLKEKEKWKNKEFREKQTRAILKGLMKRPTSYEQKIISLCKKHNLPFNYVGDGQVFICCRNPDFIHNNVKKLLIETYCSFYKQKNYERVRSKLFAKYGFKTLFLKDEDLLSKNWEEICSQKIKRFESDSNG